MTSRLKKQLDAIRQEKTGWPDWRQTEIDTEVSKTPIMGITMEYQWKQIEPGTIILGQQKIVFCKEYNQFIWYEGDVLRVRQSYLRDAKVRAETRQSEMEEIGLASPAQMGEGR